MAANETDAWAVWCRHVLLELERLDRESRETMDSARKAFIFSLVVQAQLILGGIGLGYVIKMVIDHITKG